jgi:hypothetical protein
MKHFHYQKVKRLSLLKKSGLAVALSIALLFSVLPATWFVGLGAASSSDEVYVPSFGTLYIQIYSPEDHVFLRNPVNFTVGAAVHYPGLDSFKYSVDVGPWIPLPLHGPVGTFGVLESVSLNLSRGYHSIKAEASFFGYTVRADVDFAVDMFSPYITVVSPENKTYGITEIPLTFETGELTGLSYVLDGGQRVYVSENSSLKGLSEGSHNLIINGASVFGTSYGSDHVYFEVDTLPPKITVLPIENETCNVAQVPLNFTVGEPTSWVGYSLDGQSNVTVTGNYTLNGLSYGLHELTVYANDTSGNMGASDMIFFTIAEPFPTTIVIASAITVAVACLLVYFKKHKH